MTLGCLLLGCIFLFGQRELLNYANIYALWEKGMAEACHWEFFILMDKCVIPEKVEFMRLILSCLLPYKDYEGPFLLNHIDNGRRAGAERKG